MSLVVLKRKKEKRVLHLTATHHCHNLGNGRVGHTQLVDDSRQDKSYTEAADTVTDPDKNEWDKRGVIEGHFELVEVPCFSLHVWRSLSQVCVEGLFFLGLEKFGRINV